MGDELFGNWLYGLWGDQSIVSNENGDLFVRDVLGNDHYTTAAGAKGDWLLRQYGNGIVVRDNDGIAYARVAGDQDRYISSLPRIEPTSSTNVATQVYTASPASEQSISGVANLSAAASYDRDWRAIKAANPDWTDDQVYAKKSEQIWNADYKIFIDDIANSKSPEEREQKISEFKTKIDRYKSSGIDTDGHIKYLRDTQGMGTESILNKVISNYVYSGVEYQYSVAPGSLVDVDIPKVDGISREKYNDYQIQKNDEENTVHNSFIQQAESFFEKVKTVQIGNVSQLTNTDLETGYQRVLLNDGITYVRARYENGKWVIHPDDMQLIQESSQAFANSTFLAVIPGLFKVVGAGGKSLYNLTRELSSPAINNPLPQNGILARVMPEKFAKLLQEGKAKLSPNGDAWVTSADDLKGIMSSEEAAKKLTLVDAEGNLRLSGNAVVEFRLKNPNGIATPINRTDPGFIGGGRTAGGAREFVIPNDAEIEIVNIRILE